jgi:diguanylate cyclase (GGDEF)-like protein
MRNLQRHLRLSNLFSSGSELEGATQGLVERRRPVPRRASFPHPYVVLTYGTLALAVAAYTVWVIARGSSPGSPAIDNWGVAGFEVVTSLLCLARGVFSRRDRTAVIVMGLGLMAWAVGDVALAAESAGGATPPTPSLPDYFYIGFYPLTYVAIMLLVRRHVRRFSIATWLDGVVAGLGAAAICAAFVFQGVLRSAGGHPGAVAVDLIYPVGDLLLLIMVVGGTAILPGRTRAPWLMLAGGYALNAIGDTFNLFGSGIGATHVGTAFNAVAWPIAILLVSASVWLRPTPADIATHERPPGLLLPGLSTLASLLILLLAALHHADQTAVGLATATLAVAAVRVGASLMRLRNLTEERHSQAVTDQLTTLGNRRGLFELLDELLHQHQSGEEGARKLAFLYMDLNRFKEVNDSFGHSVGDELLRQLGTRLSGALRTSDLLVRLGGDEFGVALMDANADYGATVAQRLAARLEEPFLLGNVRARISVSIGIAVVPDDAVEAHDLLRCADLAMYRAKTEGKSFATYQEELDGRANRLGLVEELREAIEQRQLNLHYQTQMDTTTGEVVALEALVRWLHPRLGYVPPLEFLPLAEEADLMGPLTALVLEQALDQVAEWRRRHPKLTVSVNISTTNLLSPGFPDMVVELLGARGLSPDALVLEITETTAMADVNRCREVTQELRDRGLVVSVDDFGAGFTSLAYLSSLAVRELKLDRSFINGLTTADDERDLALVRSTIKLAHSLGLRVVAEGVEDESCLNLLMGLDCDVVQGYLISSPKPATEVSLEPYPTLSTT